GHDRLRLAVRPLRTAWAARDLLLLARAVAALPALRRGRVLAVPVGGDLRPELHRHGAADDHADGQHLRTLLGGRAVRLDLLLAPGRRGAGRGARGLDLRVDRLVRPRVRDRRGPGPAGRWPDAHDPRGARDVPPADLARARHH